MMGKWQPMETAPKDGTAVLLRLKPDHTRFPYRPCVMVACIYVVGVWDAGTWVSDIVYCRDSEYGDYFPEEIEPEAWCLIPC